MAHLTTQLDVRVRAVRDADAAALIELIGGVYAEYPGCVLDLDGVDADLVAPATSFARSRSRLWVLDDPEGITATVGAGPLVADTVELKRLYVAARARRRGLGAQLVGHVEEQATLAGARRVELWSDSRFRDAHRLYQRLGYRDTGQRRQLHDPSATTEHNLARTLPG